MRALFHLVLLAGLLTNVACKSDSDQPQGPSKDKDGGPKQQGGRSGHSPGSGFIGDDARVIELDDSGRPIVRDGSTATDDVPDAARTDGQVVEHPSQDGGSEGPVLVPVDPGAPGPWPVGVRTLDVDLGSGRTMPAEVWYPAQRGSEADKSLYTYELADWLPPQARDMLPSDELPIPVPCNCYRDLPIDTEHGPFPVSIFVQAYGGARVEVATLAAHWASRGFVVVAADHPGMTLADLWEVLSTGTCTGSGVSEDLNRDRDVPAEVRALRDAKADWEFLANRTDLSKIAVSGRIAGAEYAAGMNGKPGVRLIMAWSSGFSGKAEGDVKEVVYITGQENSWYTDSYAMVKAGFNNTKAGLKPTLLVGIDNAASQSLTPYCTAKSSMSNSDGEHLSVKYRFCGLTFADALSRSDCKPEYISQEQADTIFKYVTTAALEEALTGKDPSVAWGGFNPEWGELIEAR